MVGYVHTVAQALELLSAPDIGVTGRLTVDVKQSANHSGVAARND